MNENILVINVLLPENFQDCHITGSINVPLAQLESFAKTVAKDKEIILYCAHGQCKASKVGYHKLRELGFQNIFVFEGGTQEWYQLDYPVEGRCNFAYLTEKIVPGESPVDIKTISAFDLKKRLGM